MSIVEELRKKYHTQRRTDKEENLLWDLYMKEKDPVRRKLYGQAHLQSQIGNILRKIENNEALTMQEADVYRKTNRKFKESLRNPAKFEIPLVEGSKIGIPKKKKTRRGKR